MDDQKNKYPMFGGLFIAVFNCTDIGRRLARKEVIDKYGECGWKKVKERMTSGIMELFHHRQTPETKLYAETVGLHAERYHAKRAARVVDPRVPDVSGAGDRD